MFPANVALQCLIGALALVIALGAAHAAGAQERMLRILAIGTHPDDCEWKVGGVAAKWAALGHKVKFVSVTNGDIGHHEMAGGPLALRRSAEVKEADRLLGVESQVLDHHDGELMPTLDIRKELIRIVREWRADVVITHRPNDYHPDHRYTSILVQDGAVMVTIPFICPDVPPLKDNPVYLYMSDSFKKPYAFQPDVAVAIDDTIEKKLEALTRIKSQLLEWGPWISGDLDKVPKKPDDAKKWLMDGFRTYFMEEAQPFKAGLAPWYGADKVDAIKQFEAFEICEYGRQPSKDEIRKLFPFFPPAR